MPHVDGQVPIYYGPLAINTRLYVLTLIIASRYGIDLLVPGVLCMRIRATADGVLGWYQGAIGGLIVVVLVLIRPHKIIHTDAQHPR